MDNHDVIHGWFLRDWHFVALNDPNAGSASGSFEGTDPFNIDERGDTIVGGYADSHGNAHGFIVHLGS